MAVNKASFTNSLFFKIMFFCLFGLTLIVGVVLTVNVRSLSQSSERIDYIEEWTVTDSSGKSFDAGRTYDDKRAFSEEFTIVSKLPDNIGHDSILCFYNRSDVKVYVNGELRKEFDRIKDTGVPGGSMKEFYMTVPVIPSDAGGELKIIRGKTDWNPMVVSETFVTTNQGITDYMIGKYGISFALMFILFVAALLSSIVGIVLRVRYGRSINMLYAAFGILVVSCWLLSVSQMTPFVTGLYYVDGLMGFLFCMMMPFALLIYLNSIQKYRYDKVYSAMICLTVVDFILWTVLHFTGVINFQNALIFIDSVLGLIVLGIAVTVVLDIKNGHLSEYRYTAIGFLVFMIMSIAEIAVIIISQNDASQIAMIIGLFCLLVLVAIQQIDDILKERKRLENEIRKKNKEKEQMLIHIVQTLAGTIDAKDTYTKGHSSRVADYTREIARRYGYDDSALTDIYMMALLHDIGKIGVPDAVINKPGKLSDEEYEIIKRHPVMGANILEKIKEKPELALGAKWHHEKYGGNGYPDGIKGEEIPEQARIIAVADAYDAMTSYRSYRDPMPQEKVRSEIKKGRGTQFDPQFADIMLQMMAEDKSYALREKKK